MSATVTATDPREIHCFTNEIIRVPDELIVLSDGEEAPEGMRLLAHHDEDDGDKRVVWDSTSLGQISEAKKLFEKLMKEGMQPFRVGTDGTATSAEMTEFDPFAEEVIFIQMKHVVGG